MISLLSGTVVNVAKFLFKLATMYFTDKNLNCDHHLSPDVEKKIDRIEDAVENISSDVSELKSKKKKK